LTTLSRSSAGVRSSVAIRLVLLALPAVLFTA
jgi:hypothetical protein